MKESALIGSVAQARGEGEPAHGSGAVCSASARAPELLFGLGRTRVGPVEVRLVWRDGFGVVRRALLELAPGWHTIVLAQGPSP